ncbi:MAG: ABC transporter ATP-binding protein [Rhizobacter sp.]|nr:ABC transporter ATP-binding protein [Burkholderiales bacterium]
MAPIISISGLRVAYGNHEVLKGIDLAIAPGSFVALLGASGCGKTTLLRTLAGFTPASGGSIRVEGRDALTLPPERRGMAMVFQSYALWSHMTVAQNIGYGLKLRGMPRDKIGQRVAAQLAMLGLTGYEQRSVAELSGGQRQRVALGRALAVEPKILLLDEPLSNLDARIRVQMRHEIRSIQKKLGLTAILVTHDREEAMVMADLVVVLDQGRIAQMGTPEAVFQRPASPFVAAFMGAENIIDCEAKRNGAGIDLRIPAIPASQLHCPMSSSEDVASASVAADADGPVQVHFRSEAAFLREAGASVAATLQFPGRISQVSYLGSGYRCEVNTDCGAFFVDHPTRFAPDDGVTVCIPGNALHVFRRDLSRQAAPAKAFQ